MRLTVKLLVNITRLLAFICFFSSSAYLHAAPKNAVAMYGEPKYSEGFSHFEYANPQAPKGGQLRMHTIGSFDSFNSFVARGQAAIGTRYLYDTLTVASQDEPFTQYGLLAETIDIAADRSSVTYTLRQQARFADGQPVTAEDVKFTFELLLEEGSPFYAFYYEDVESVEVLDKRTVKFSLQPGDNRELALIIGQLPVLPKHFWQDKDFTRSGLTPPLGSGPYHIKEFDAGKRVTYARRDDYWGKDLAVNKGHYNFDEIRFIYFLDDTVSLEAFKGGHYDVRIENVASNWANAYEGPALRRGDIHLDTIKHRLPAGMQGFAYNLRRDLFQDPVLRKALSYAFDFEWTNKNLFHGQYRRTHSFFENSELAAQGLPSTAELALLNPLKEQLPKEVFTTAYAPPSSDGSGRPRENLLAAQNMLKEAGYTLKGKQLFNPSGQPVTFEILLNSAAWDRITLPFVRNLKMLGVEANVRRIDVSQYEERLRQFDFDMVVQVFPQSNSPGNEQRDFWHSSAADRNDSRNIIGIKNPAIDKLVEAVIRAQDRDALIASTRALDRALQWNHYVIPNWYLDRYRVARWQHIKFPDRHADYGLALDTWWSDKEK